jgi:hypothetical protein
VRVVVSGAGERSVGLGTVLGAVWRREWDRVTALTPRCPRRVALVATAGFSLPGLPRETGFTYVVARLSLLSVRMIPAMTIGSCVPGGAVRQVPNMP